LKKFLTLKNLFLFDGIAALFSVMIVIVVKTYFAPLLKLPENVLHCLDKKYSLRSAEREFRCTKATMMQQRRNSRSALQTVKFKQTM
jgi:hypothetical protein